MKKILALVGVVVVGLAVVVAVSYNWGRAVGSSSSRDAQCSSLELSPVTTITITDTLVIHDTVRIDRPRLVERRTVDTIRVEVSDTVRIVEDGRAVEFPLESRWYADSTYRACVSGYRPELSYIEVYPQTTRIQQQTTTLQQSKTRRWGVGVQAGVGAGRSGLSPYVGVGLSYNLLAF